MPEFDSDKLLEALLRFIERMNWFTVGKSPEDALETDKIKLLLAEWDEGLEPWRGRIPKGEMSAAYDQLQPLIKQARAKVRLIFLAELHKLLEKRVLWLMCEHAMKVPGRINAVLADATPERREELLALARETLGKEMDTAEMFQDMMELADGKEAGWKKDFDQFKKEWDEECTPEIESRLLKSDAPQSALWMAELLPDMIRIQKEYPDFL